MVCNLGELMFLDQLGGFCCFLDEIYRREELLLSALWFVVDSARHCGECECIAFFYSIR